MTREHISLILVILYSYFRSSASWRVRIALAIKDINYEYKAVHLVKDGGQQHSEEYKRLNPMEQVPTLVIDGHTLTQSLPIIEYLEERNPEPPLLPKDSFGRAQVRALSELINSGIQPLQNSTVLEKVGDGKEEWARSFIVKGFQALETLLKQTSGKYSYGDTVTMADLCLVPQMFAAKRFKVDLEPFPTICRVHDALAELSAFKAADASNQPDTPDELRST
ncbi:maleylacetoacetate isomerase-like isoform X1 [Biomphalaria glabrata]|uniref:Maleylacetoacetate isomerase-like isoform X1 n=1 Tax=Biomphalaria glabrata TaxID=6526 RepID=A0A9U8EET4_BIOGL|nr:maleylacetoacetate isomerase-like isoform X1 [Biomphalaria glabrata]